MLPLPLKGVSVTQRCYFYRTIAATRRRFLLLPTLFLPLLPAASHSSFATPFATAGAGMKPPVPTKIEHEMVMFGDVRKDDYYWLRDDSRSDPRVLEYLRQENAYTDFVLSGSKTLQDQLFTELKGRIKEDDISAPLRDGPYFYYTRTLEGKEYVQHCRQPIPNGEGPGSVHEVMPTGPDSPLQHIILDENVKAQGHEYYSVGAFKVSPNHKLVAYAEDTKGDEIYTVYVIEAETQNLIGKPIVGVTEYIEWAGNEVLLYITNDEIHRPYKQIQLFINNLVVYEREDGLLKVTVYGLPAAGKAIECLQDGQVVEFIDPIYEVESVNSQYNSHVLRFSYSSMRTPPSVYDHDMDSRVTVLKKVEAVLGGFNTSNYVTERKWSVASDGTRVPISIVYRKDLVKLNGTDPLLLYGYGSYEICIDPDFRTSRLSLIDRGFVYAIAHVRGGGEMGRKWYEDGKFLEKRNTFTDFISCAEYLLENKYGSKEKICIHGRSAGGLLIGAVLNMRPDLFKAAVAGVPFVDVVTTMLDPTIPLTTSEWEIKPQNYPHILVTAGLNDPRVLYSEPAKFVAKLRDMKTDNNLLLFKCELGAGHFSKSGRFEKLQEDAFTYTFILKALDMVPPLES
ncbi:Protease 2 [Nymphaea thermarum]|nr:Protease 2 [Nymphaea thermarum]